MDRRARLIGLALALVAITAAIVVIEAPWEEGSTVPAPAPGTPEEALEHRGAPNFKGATTWINGGPVNLTDKRGQVVLVDFWTYSCRNCLNTFPYLKAWHDAYNDSGLTIVGVHTPEFRFERDVENVQAAVDRHGLEYPIALDNGYDIWDAYNNRFWPAKYLIDQHGRIVGFHAGEGQYQETEDAIRRELKAAGFDPGPRAQVDSEAGGIEAGITFELFTSDLRGQGQSDIANEQGFEPNRTVTYAFPDQLEADRIYLNGTWRNTEQAVIAQEDGARVHVNFTAGGMNVVAGGANGACLLPLLDGDPLPKGLAGVDVSYPDGLPCVELDGQRAYDLYSGPFETHDLRLVAPEGLEVYSFAFSAEGFEHGSS